MVEENSEKEVIILGDCLCCGGKTSVSISEGWVDVYCEPPEEKEKRICKDYERKMCMTCKLDSAKFLQVQAKYAEIIFDKFQEVYDRDNRLYFTAPKRDIENLIERLSEAKWYHGRLEDEHGVYYRAFPNEIEYGKALLYSYNKGHHSGKAKTIVKAELIRMGLLDGE